MSLCYLCQAVYISALTLAVVPGRSLELHQRHAAAEIEDAPGGSTLEVIRVSTPHGSPHVIGLTRFNPKSPSPVTLRLGTTLWQQRTRDGLFPARPFTRFWAGCAVFANARCCRKQQKQAYRRTAKSKMVKAKLSVLVTFTTSLSLCSTETQHPLCIVPVRVLILVVSH